METVVYVYGAATPQEGEALVKDMNEEYNKLDNTKKVKQADDPNTVWTVKINVKYVYSKEIDESLKKMGKQNEPATVGEGGTINTLKKAGVKIPDGDNIYKINEGIVKRGYKGISGQGVRLGEGISTPKTVIHETFHMLGYDERYRVASYGGAKIGITIPEFMDDVNSNDQSDLTIMDFKFVDLLDKALARSSIVGTGMTTIYSQ